MKPETPADILALMDGYIVSAALGTADVGLFSEILFHIDKLYSEVPVQCPIQIQLLNS
jgi:hypothetical protein